MRERERERERERKNREVVEASFASLSFKKRPSYSSQKLVWIEYGSISLLQLTSSFFKPFLLFCILGCFKLTSHSRFLFILWSQPSIYFCNHVTVLYIASKQSSRLIFITLNWVHCFFFSSTIISGFSIINSLFWQFYFRYDISSKFTIWIMFKY